MLILKATAQNHPKASDRTHTSSKSLRSIMRDNVRYLYTDLTGQTIQPVVFDEVADLEHNYTLTEPQRENQLMTQAN